MNNDSIIFIDVEASGLHGGSYPTEVGWCSHDLRRGASYLIRTTTEWLAGPWSIEAETVTGISLAMLECYGLPPAAVVNALNGALAGTHPRTDAPWMDGRWLTMLHDAVGIAPTYGICPPPPQEPGWKAQMAWAEQKAPYDLALFANRVDAHPLMAAARQWRGVGSG